MVMNIWTIKSYNCFQIYSYDKYICKLVFQTQYLKVFSEHYHIAIQTLLFSIYYSNSKVYTVSYGLSCWLLYVKFSSFENRRGHVYTFKIYLFSEKIGNLPLTFFSNFRSPFQFYDIQDLYNLPYDLSWFMYTMGIFLFLLILCISSCSFSEFLSFPSKHFKVSLLNSCDYRGH